MTSFALSVVLACTAPVPGTPAPRPAPTPAIEAAVDRRVELLTLVARLADFEEFNMANASSPYARAADAWFREFRGHAAVQRLRELRRTRGVSYDAIASLAVHVEDSVGLEERVAFDLPPERLDARWGLEGARALLADLRDFVQVAKSEEFFDSQQERFDAASVRLRAVIEKSQALPWFDRVFGERRGARYCAIPGFLCGGGNYGVGIRFPPKKDGGPSDEPEEILPVFGCSSFDADGIPVFGAEMGGLVIHELCHSYTNVLVDQIAAQLEKPAGALFATCADAMRRQAYADWKTMSYESLVRACVVRCRTVTESEAAGKKQRDEEVARGFAWVPALADEIGRFEADRKQWPTFADFLPQVVACFERAAERAKEADAKAPHLVTMAPANGSRDLAAGDGELVFTFDRAMRTDSYSVMGEPAKTPKARGKPTWDASGKVFTLPVRFEAGTSYRFRLNSETRQGFQSRDGVALAPVEITLATQ